MLQPGITGFRHHTDIPLPSCDLTAFHALCYAAARSVSGRVIQIEDLPSPSANFACAELECGHNTLAVLLNHHFPVIGFAVPTNHADTGPLQFLDHSQLSEAFQAVGGYTVATHLELSRPLFRNDIEKLSPTEIEQLKYWRPVRMGDIVFNFWD